MISHWLHCTYSTLDFSTLHDSAGFSALREMSVVICICLQFISILNWIFLCTTGKICKSFWLLTFPHFTAHSGGVTALEVSWRVSRSSCTDGYHGQQVARCGRQLSKCHSDALLSSAVFCWVLMYVTLAIGYCIDSEQTANRKATCSSQPTTNLTMSSRCSRDACTRGF